MKRVLLIHVFGITGELPGLKEVSPWTGETVPVDFPKGPVHPTPPGLSPPGTGAAGAQPVGVGVGSCRPPPAAPWCALLLDHRPGMAPAFLCIPRAPVAADAEMMSDV